MSSCLQNAIDILTAFGTIGAAVAAWYAALESKRAAQETHAITRENHAFSKEKLRIDLIMELAEIYKSNHAKGDGTEISRAIFQILLKRGFDREELEELILYSKRASGAAGLDIDRIKKDTKDWG